LELMPCTSLTILFIFVILQVFFVKIYCKNNQPNQLNNGYQNLNSIEFAKEQVCQVFKS